ncbi:MAG: hypothetical protein HRU09_10940 [Oligoflexales bacterium]|nr:hypothetical protein [Oligoflexales bacterium]
MLYAQIWYFGILLIAQLHIGIFALTWQKTCERMIFLRYKILESPSKAHKELCKNPEKVLPPNYRGSFINFTCYIDVLWRNHEKLWIPWCLERNARFPPRYYQMELGCRFWFAGQAYERGKILWKLKR